MASASSLSMPLLLVQLSNGSLIILKARMSYRIAFHLRFLLCEGLMGSIVVSGYGFGSLVWIPAETAFVNPDNIKPAAPECLGDVECEEVSEKYFTDSSLLEK